jgi:group I intron endonuclease
MGCIYKITNIITHEEYIGKTVKDDISDRFNEHISNGRNISGASKIAKSLREYGSLNHIITILEQCDNDLLLRQEQYWIDKLNTLHIGLNIKNEFLNKERNYWGNFEKAMQNLSNNDVWNKGISPKEETRKKISKTKKKKNDLGLYKNFGHSHTEETKQKLSEIAKARDPISFETRQKIGMSSKDRKFYYSINDKKRIFLKSSDPVPEGYVEGKGTIWVTKIGKNVSIDIWDLQKFITNGYEKGRV